MVTITKYVWDTVSDCVLTELDENNAVTAVYTNEPQQYGGVLSQRRGTTSHYHHHDALGSTRFLTDSSGNVTDTYLYDAWGNSVASTGTIVNPFKWVGKYGYYTDNSTGQVYVRARMYQPALARWCSLDPFFESSWGNLLRYSENRTVSLSDPSGLQTYDEYSGECCCCCVESATVVNQATVLKDLMDRFGNRLPGHGFDFTVRTVMSMRLRLSSSRGTGNGCKITWLEFSSHPASGLPPWTWNNVGAHHGDDSATLEEWNEWDPKKASCPNTLTLDATDTPRAPLTTQKVLLFAIRVESSEYCGCEIDKIDLYGLMLLFDPWRSLTWPKEKP